MLSVGYVDVVWRVFGCCLVGVVMLSEGCMDVVWRVCRCCLEDMLMFC